MKPLLITGLLAASTPDQQPVCVTQEEVKDMVLYLLPDVIDDVGSKCRGALPGDAFLLGGAQDLSRRLRGERSAHASGALAGFRKIAGKESPDLDEEKMGQLIAKGVGEELVGRTVKPQTCLDVNEAAELVAPLPTDNLGRLSALLMRMSMAGEKRSRRPPICQPVRR